MDDAKDYNKLYDEMVAVGQWDEGAFTDTGNSGPAMYGLASTAPPTRAPTPRSGLQPSSAEEADADLNRALQASMGGGGDGSAGSAVFGPPNREEEWAMVPYSRPSTTGEIIPDVKHVEERRVKDGEPRFLKHLPDGDYLPNLLTICHGIAGAREELLMREHAAADVDYGEDAEWWKGNAIALPKIVHLESGEPVQGGQRAKEEALVMEVQRIMAFMDDSQRSYANVGSLTQTDLMQEARGTGFKPTSYTVSFLEAWTAVAKSDLFNSVAQTDNGKQDFKIMDLTNPDGEQMSISELLDDSLWSKNAPEQGIECLADVLVMQLKQGKTGVEQLKVEIPPEMHLDKYLLANVRETWPFREQIAAARQRIEKIAAIEKKLTCWKHPTKDEEIPAKDLLTRSAAVLSPTIPATDDQDNVIPEGIPAPNYPADWEAVSKKLEQIIINIDAKLAALTEQKEKTRTLISSLSSSPLPENFERKLHYTLRGVATKPNVTYVLLPEGDDEHVEDMDLGESTPEGMRWWRIEYEVVGPHATVKKTVCPDYDVLRAVELEHSSALIIYASDSINDVALHNPTLPAPLKQFVDRDNFHFLQELRDATSAAAPAYVDGIRQSIEVETREQRRSSMDSDFVHMGDGDGDREVSPDYEAGGFGLDNPDIKVGEYEVDQDVHEIRLGDDTKEQEMEMVEKGGVGSLMPGLERGRVGSGGEAEDERMGGFESQDDGFGGAV